MCVHSHRTKGRRSADATRIRVLESFGQPKTTTNPYITQLHDGLAASVEVMTFTFRTAFFDRYDLAHIHWPELFVDGHNWRGRLVRRTLTALLLTRWHLTNVPLVRTVHNLERPSGISRFDHWTLDRFDRLTAVDIRLNEQTPQRNGIPSVIIPHGHYRDWFARFPQVEAVPGRIGYVGLIRRYKGVESLVAAFSQIDDDALTLAISGRPSNADLVSGLTELIGEDARVTLDARFLDEAELVHAITAAELIVLPYRHMHNSGTVLAALSLGRPVLVPDNEVNRALALEVGDGWVHLFQGELTPDDLRAALAAPPARGSAPDLSARDWSESIRAHLTAFRTAMGRRAD